MDNKNEKRIFNSNLVIVIAVVLLTFLILAVVWIKLHEGGEKTTKNPSNPPAQTMVVTEKEHHSYNGITDLTIKSGDGRKATLEFMNTGNNDCVQVLTIQDDQNKELYKSDYILAGKYVTEVELNRDFEPGTYDIKIWVRSYKDTKDHEQISGVCYQKKLIVEK